MSVVILIAPRAWGKTHHKEALRKHFACQDVIDDFRAYGQNLPPAEASCLVLTDTMPYRIPKWARIVQHEEADAALRAVGGEPFGGRRK